MKSNPAWETVRESFSSRYLLVRMLKTEWITRRKETIIMLTGLAVFWTLLGVHHNPFKSILCKSIIVRVELLWQQCNWSLLLRGKLRYRQVCWLPCSNLVPGATRVGLLQLLHLVLTLCYLCWVFDMITGTDIDDPKRLLHSLTKYSAKKIKRMLHLTSFRSPDKRKDKAEKKVLKTKCWTYCLRKKIKKINHFDFVIDD